MKCAYGTYVCSDFDVAWHGSNENLPISATKVFDHFGLAVLVINTIMIIIPTFLAFICIMRLRLTARSRGSATRSAKKSSEHCVCDMFANTKHKTPPNCPGLSVGVNTTEQSNKGTTLAFVLPWG